MRTIVRILILTLTLGAIQLQGQDGLSVEARSYIDAALQTMQENFLHKDRINWEQLRKETYSRAMRAQKSVDTYDAIRFALAQLGDHHSFLQLTPALAQEESSRKAASSNLVVPAEAQKVLSPYQNRRLPEASILENGSHPIGRIVIPLFIGQDRDGFATKVQALVAETAARSPCAWIVDLRGNGGGNMWPMLVGVGPILGEGEVGAFLDHDGNKIRWYYEKGIAGTRTGNQSEPSARTSATPVTLSDAPPVAVLIDAGTGSSGEAIAVAFRGRPDTRFFGQPTFGLSNSTFPFMLSDGAQLFLVVAVDLDRDGNEYDSGVRPDQEIPIQSEAKADDLAQGAAVRWLTEQRKCLVAQ